MPESIWGKKTDPKDRNIRTFWKGIRMLWELLGDQKRRVFLTFIMILLLNILGVIFPYIMKMVFDELQNIIKGQAETGYLWKLVAAFSGLIIFSIFFTHRVQNRSLIRAIVRLENWWPVLAQEKLLSLSIAYHERENTGKKVEKIRKGCDKCLDLISNFFWYFLPQILYFTVNIVVITWIDWRLGLIFFLPFIPASIIQIKVIKRFGVPWEKYEEEKEKASGVFTQSIMNVVTVQSCGQEDREKKLFRKIHDEMERIDLAVSLKMQDYEMLTRAFTWLGFAATIAVSVFFIVKGKSTMGTLVYISTTGATIMENFWHTLDLYSRIVRDNIAVARMKAILDQKVDLKSTPDATILKEITGDIALHNVTFAYPGREPPVISDLSLEIPAGKMVAIVGASGCGKTTILRLINRAYDVGSGKIILDGHDVRSIFLPWYRQLFAIVQQSVQIFDDTIRYNVTYPYPEATDEQVAEALKAANLETVLKNKKRFPKGILTETKEMGTGLSGGERQRIGIARAYIALLFGARFLILDEATSNMDSRGERLIQKAIQRMLAALSKDNRISVIAVAHRFSTIQMADIIYVIDDGKVVEKGTHTELISRSGSYAKFVEFQNLKK
ncbi:MAG: ABC transporter ATP-binding protein [Patescibacteria group bacterium]